MAKRPKRERQRTKNPAHPPSTVLVWMRSVGAASILLGGLGLMQTFFLPSVIAIYFGLALLLLDAYKENFRLVVRGLIMLTLVAAAILFTTNVTLRESPIFAVYRMVDGKLDIIITNASASDDYQDLDLIIRPDFPKDYISKKTQITTLPSVSFVDPMPFASDRQGDSIVLTVDPNDPTGQHQYPKTNFLRVRCDKLPHLTSIELEMELVRLAGEKNERQEPFHDVQIVTIDGSFNGRFSEKAVSLTAMRSPMPSQ